jgi:hypothetical protein
MAKKNEGGKRRSSFAKASEDKGRGEWVKGRMGEGKNGR